MNIEGSRHERVVLIAVAYLIGFVTAFIGFGVNITTPNNPVKLSVVDVNNTAGVINSLPSQREGLSVAVTAEGLVANVAGQERLLSASQYNFTAGEFAYVDGVFAAIVGYDISPENDFIYFCEQPTTASSACKPFVYQVATNALYPVTQGGERIALAASAHEVDWGSRGPATVAGIAVDPLSF